MTARVPVAEAPPVTRASAGNLPFRVAAPEWLFVLLLLPAALAIGCWNIHGSGILWADSPQYANAAAMIHDWLKSGDWLHPWQFAQQNYAMYPAFHLPYHPPVYPGLLGTLFLFTGVSWTAARVFVAVCLWVSCGSFYLMLRILGHTRPMSLLSALVLMTAPVVATWSRDSMSEVPGLAFIMAASWCFLRWLDDTDRAAWLVAAFALAETAFLSRLLTAGVLPAWFLFALLRVGLRPLVRPLPVLCSALYLGFNLCWVIWVKQFSRFETFTSGVGPTVNYSSPLSVLTFAAGEAPKLIGLAGFVLAAAALVFFARAWGRLALWLMWLLSYAAFVCAVGIYSEQRYLIYLAPALAGLAATAATSFSERVRTPMAGVLLLSTALTTNGSSLATMPQGLRGYAQVAEALASQRDAGNVLVGAEYQADLMFRYRSVPGALPRSFLRADRLLAIRPPAYAPTSVKVVAGSESEVVDLIRRGRARYVVSFRDAQPNSAVERTLLHDVVQHRRDFQLIGQWPLMLHMQHDGLVGDVFVWRYTGELPAGPSELPVIVPTADFQELPPPGSARR